MSPFLNIVLKHASSFQYSFWKLFFSIAKLDTALTHIWHLKREVQLRLAKFSSSNKEEENKKN